MEILRIENLSFRYPNAKKDAITDISLTVNNGEFIVLCGESGCGKTTLLKLIKKEIAPVGEKSGEVFYKGIPQDELDDKISASDIGYVFQNPDSQIVTDKVWHELAFGLENMGIPSEIIRRRVGEMASYFGIQEWFHKNTDELSGGQKQLLNLASIMAMQPEILILDEPTSQLDPISAGEFISTLQKLNREFGLTIILVEHRLEEVFPIADKIALMDNGKLLLYDAPRVVGEKLSDIQTSHPMRLGLPSAVRIYNSLNISDECPLTVKEGRDFLERHFSVKQSTDNQAVYSHSEDIAVELKNVSFRYQKDQPDVLRDTSMQVYKGEIYSILGGNGAGKTTVLNLIAALDKPYRGKILIEDKKVSDYKGNTLYSNCLAYLPQDPQTLFIKDNVKDDLKSVREGSGTPECESRIEEISEMLGISYLLDMHPYDLSGGEQQKCALAKILMRSPRILLLDEPTKGLDANFKYKLKNILSKLKKDGKTIIIVTHDVEFAAENSDRCALFFDGGILSVDAPTRFFAENNFYTTSANRMARRIWHNAVTCEQVVENARANGVESR